MVRLILPIWLLVAVAVACAGAAPLEVKARTALDEVGRKVGDAYQLAMSDCQAKDTELVTRIRESKVPAEEGFAQRGELVARCDRLAEAFEVMRKAHDTAVDFLEGPAPAAKEAP